MSISEVLSATRDQLSGKWLQGIATLVVYGIISALLGSVAVGALVLGHLSVGLALWSLKISRGQDASIENLFGGFKNIVSPLVAYLLFVVAIVFGIFFLIIPGIVLALGLSQTFYILADDSERDGFQALKDSWNMMKGHKTTYFMMHLRFFLLGILCLFTLGIGFFFLAPYVAVANANFYLAINGGGHDSFDAEYRVD